LHDYPWCTLFVEGTPFSPHNSLAVAAYMSGGWK